MPTRRAAFAAALTLSLGTTGLVQPATAADAFGIPYLKEPITGQTIGNAPVHHPGAPVPQPFTTDYLAGFQSDISSYQYGVYWEVVRLYDFIKAERPDIRATNLDKAIAINNGAAGNAPLIHRAQVDAAADTAGVYLTVADALGPEFASAFRQAVAENRLPKTQYLFGNGYAARAGGLASSTFPEKYYFNTDRPHEVGPDQIRKYPDGKNNFYLTSPSFPSGHANQAAWVTALMAFMLPEAGPQLIYRGAQSGESRVIMGVHFPLDVIGGRMTGQAAAADRLSDPRMAHALHQASLEIRAEMQWRTGKTIAELVSTNPPYITSDAANASYAQLMGYDFAPAYHTDAPMIVPRTAPALLAASHPHLTWQQRAEVLRLTAAPAGHPLDWQGPGGSWQRINLVKALTAQVTVGPDGRVSVA